MHQSQPKRKQVRITHLPNRQSKNVFLAFFCLIRTWYPFSTFLQVFPLALPFHLNSPYICYTSFLSSSLELFLLSAAFLLFVCLFLPVWSQDSGQYSDQAMCWTSNQQRHEIFHFPSVETSSEAHPASQAMGTGGSSPQGEEDWA